jgi:hypothetical protein
MTGARDDMILSRDGEPSGNGVVVVN